MTASHAQKAGIRRTWESAAPGWARWEPAVAQWMAPATDEMLAMAGVVAGVRIIDLACGAGSQTLAAAARAGPRGAVLAIDIAEAMLAHVRESARGAGLTNVETLAVAAEDLDVPAGSFDAAISRLGLMLFADPAGALQALRRALRPQGKVAVVVFTSPAANPMLARPMQVLLRHAGKAPPAPGSPGLFSLGAPGVLRALFERGGFVDVEERTIAVPLRMASAGEALAMMQEAFGAYRAVVADCAEPVRAAAWAEVAGVLEAFAHEGAFLAPSEVLVAAARRPAG